MSAGNDREFIDFLQTKEKGGKAMSLGIYKVEWTNLGYSGVIGDKEIDFLEGFRNEDGTFLLDEDLLDVEIEAYKQQDKEGELPQELIDFLRQKVKESEYGDLAIVVS